MKSIKYLTGLVISIALLLLVLANFSVVESHYKCSGESSLGQNKTHETLFMALERYRPWVSLWSESDGNMTIELPNEAVRYYSHITEVDTQFQIYSSPNDLEGQFSTLSRSISVQTPDGLFEGQCEIIQ